MHVLEIIGNAIVGGMEQHVRTLIEHLPNDQFRISCICPYESLFTQTLKRLGCRVLILPLKDEPPWRSIQCAVAWIRQFEVDMIHAHLPNAHALAGLAGALTGTPVVATIHGMQVTPLDLSIALTTNTHLLTVCQSAYLQALAMGVANRAVSLIPNGVDLRQFRQRSGRTFRRSLGIGKETPLVGFVGRLAWEKGPDRFVRAAEIVHAECPEARFVIVGEGAMEDHLRKMVRQAKLEKCVFLAGLAQDTCMIFPALDIVVQPSRSEGLPLATLEAMACARPVVGMAVGGLPELIQPGTTGFLIDSGELPGISSAFGNDAEGIAGAVLCLLKRPDLLKQMGQAGRERAEGFFDIEQTVCQTTELFRRLASSRRNVRIYKPHPEMLMAS